MSGVKWALVLPQLVSRINHKNDSVVAILKVVEQPFILVSGHL